MKKLSAQATDFLACQSLRDLAIFFQVPEAKLRGHIYGKGTRYIKKEIKKKNGKSVRHLNVPNGFIAKMQRALLPILEELGYFSHVCHGFRSNHSIISNALPHRKSNCIFTVDLENFFPSIHFGRIKGLFSSAPFSFNKNVATHLANLVCFESSLPQGAPTSPILANMITYGLDKDLNTFCKKRSITYTRYADDLTFSTRADKFPTDLMDAPGSPGSTLLQLIDKHKFKLNPLKSRTKTTKQRQMVTGLVVNRKVNVDRRYIDKIRGALHAWERHGYSAANSLYNASFRLKLSRKEHPSDDLGLNLKGRISFIGSVKGKNDRVYQSLLLRLFSLNPSLLSPRERAIALQRTDFRELAKGSVFVVDNLQRGGEAEFGQGTAFYLPAIGFITCAHVLKPNAELHCPHTNKAYAITNIRMLREPHDIAVFEVEGLTPAALLRSSDAQMTVDQGVRCIGFPNYAPGASLNAIETSVAEIRVISAVKYSLLAHGIAPGKSGGPVLDKNNCVVGICQRGEERGKTNDFRVFPISEIINLLPHLKPIA